MYRRKSQVSHIINIFQNETTTPSDKGNLYLSGVYVLGQQQIKKDFHINCVLTIIDNSCYQHFYVQKKIKKHGIEHHKWIDIDDFQDITHDYIKNMLNKTNVLIHCQMGMSRSSSLVIAFLMKQFGMNYKKALHFTKGKRPIVQPNQGFERDLIRFQNDLIKIHPKINDE